MRTGEDYTKVKSSYQHYAGMSWDEINRQYIGSKIEKAVLSVHKNFKSITIPLCAKQILGVYLIDDCGDLIALNPNGKLTSLIDDLSEEKCSSCNQSKDVCAELMQMQPEETVVTIDGQDYINSVTKYFEGSNYYQIRKTWVKNYINNLVEEVETKEFLTEFDFLECGCLGTSEENINKVKEHCFTTYCSCFAPCRKSEYDIGSYKVEEGLGIIQLSRDFEYDKAFVKWRSSLPRVNGELVLPEEAFLSVVSGGCYYSVCGKKNISESRIMMYERQYKKDKGNMHIERCRMDSNALFHKIIKIPKFDLSGNG